MFDFESKINALVENYGLSLILEQKEISEFHVIKLLVENDLVDLDDYFNLDNEYKAWKEQEE
jgi:hypothetical protein|tara:strand:+ start:8337 stop:8522 length:186 start_codon:yes stop_codon:yes gene_type:complete